MPDEPLIDLPPGWKVQRNPLVGYDFLDEAGRIRVQHPLDDNSIRTWIWIWLQDGQKEPNSMESEHDSRAQVLSGKVVLPDGAARVCHVSIYDRSPAQVQLITRTMEPETALATVARTYAGTLSGVAPTEEEIDSVLADLEKTKLQTPYESVVFSFLIRDVSRAFTHQLVRYRVGTSFAQESLRFAVKSHMKVLLTGEAAKHPTLKMVALAIGMAYNQAIADGVPVQDARAVLPTNVLTSIFFTVSFRTLKAIYQQRMCCQAQPDEWTVVLGQIKDILASDPGTERLASVLRMHTPCGFRASWDRPCVYESVPSYNNLGAEPEKE